jgi:hypothetical protein
MKFFFGLLLSILVLLSFSVKASVEKLKTQTVCNLLKEKGLNTTKNWHEYKYSSQWGCNSAYQDIGAPETSYSLPNNLAFYVLGNKSSVKKAYLVLNVNNQQDAKFGHQKLLESSEVLYSKIIGVKLPNEFVNAIRSGIAFKSIVGNSNIEIKRDNWPTGKGYELHFIIN